MAAPPDLQSHAAAVPQYTSLQTGEGPAKLAARCAGGEVSSSAQSLTVHLPFMQLHLLAYQRCRLSS